MPKTDDSSKTEAKENSSDALHFRSRRFRFLGLDIQDVIKYFFGGNASIAIVVLILICVFLLKEAWDFFPNHHRDLKIYRQAGLEYVDYLRVQTDQQKKVTSHLNQALSAEISAEVVREDRILAAFGTAQRYLADRYHHQYDRIQSLEDWRSEQERKGESVAVGKAEGQIAELRTELLREGVLLTSKTKTIRKLRGVKNLVEEEWKIVHDSLLHFLEHHNDEAPQLVAVQEERDRRLEAANERFSGLAATIKAAKESRKPLTDLWNELRKVTDAANEKAISHKSADARRAALLSFAAKATDPAEKAKKQAAADAVNLEAPDYGSLTKPIYASVARHHQAAATLTGDLEAALARLPDPVTEKATEQFEKAREEAAKLDELVRSTRPKVDEWQHDEPFSFLQSIKAFFFGKHWVTNSSWYDFYGLLPLFTGSLLISIVAIVVAVPFSVGAAIYVNQLCGHREQSFIKPVVEFIGAIPSVVLGFFGIVVLGTLLQDVSEIEWLSWVPGFPMAARLNILNAGLLLALMAVPTIFTLAEDALNNVPKAFSEGSLALGATKLQTVLGVVVPTAISGIVAAILLGFGRIIGETMVVLLVAGNKIAVPDFTKGIGVVAEPTHTMTGIIAQELGEVDAGSLHWRALFLVGMVLFVIALVINLLAQRVIHRFQKVQS